MNFPFQNGCKTAFIGLGNKERSDDSVGLLIVNRLKEKHKNAWTEEDGLEEVVLSLIEDNTINEVVFIDAVDFDGMPGQVDIFTADEVPLLELSTHKVPLGVLMALLEKNGKNTYLIGIQPASTEFKPELHPYVHNSANEIIEYLSNF